MNKILLNDILKKLLFQKRMRAIDLVRELNIPQSTVHRLLTGASSNPHKDTLEPIAEYFDISIEQLKGVEPLPESLFSNSLTQKRVIEIPLFEWKDLDKLNNLELEKKTIAAMADLSKECFAVIMNDSSMEPQFSKGSILILDPNKKPNDRSYILIKLASTSIYVFRQIIIDAEHKFLKPLNPDLIASQMRLLDLEDTIIGVLVEARQVYKYE